MLYHRTYLNEVMVKETKRSQTVHWIGAHCGGCRSLASRHKSLKIILSERSKKTTEQRKKNKERLLCCGFRLQQNTQGGLVMKNLFDWFFNKFFKLDNFSC